MRILVISDIHGRCLERADNIADEYDMTLIAGDITHFGGYLEARDILSDFIRGRNVFAVYGNCDHNAVDHYLKEEGISVHNTLREFDGCNITGFSGAPKSHFNTPGEFDDESIGQGIMGWDEGTSIVLTHVPPYGTNLDLISSGHIGSLSVREFIEEHQPALHVCGHVHESRGIDRLGNTIIVNPGPYFQGYYADITIEGEIVCRIREF